MVSKIKCNQCGEVLSSEVGYGYRSCKCEATSMDVGRTILRLLGDYTELGRPEHKINGTN